MKVLAFLQMIYKRYLQIYWGPGTLICTQKGLRTRYWARMKLAEVGRRRKRFPSLPHIQQLGLDC